MRWYKHMYKEEIQQTTDGCIDVLADSIHKS